MQVGVLITDGGAHPPDKWARMTAFMIVNHIIPKRIAVGDQEFDIETSAKPEVAALRKARDQFEVQIMDILEQAHQVVQDGERAAIGTNGVRRMIPKPRDASVAEHIEIDKVVAEIVAAAALHPDLSAHFSRDDIKAEVTERLHMDFASVMDIERSQFADLADSDPDIKAWKTLRHPGPHPSTDA
jgi:hypothetical protein